VVSLQTYIKEKSSVQSVCPLDIRQVVFHVWHLLDLIVNLFNEQPFDLWNTDQFDILCEEESKGHSCYGGLTSS